MLRGGASPVREAGEVDRQIGERIRTRRLELGMRQERLGELIGVSLQQIHKYEKGANRVATAMLLRIAKALEIAPGALLPESDDIQAEWPSLEETYARRVIESLGALNETGRRLLADFAKTLRDTEELRR